MSGYQGGVVKKYNNKELNLELGEMSVLAIIAFIAYILAFTAIALGLYFGLRAASII